MKIANNRALAAEKKQYIIPSTTSMSFQGGFICTGSPAAGVTVVGGTLGGGGQTTTPIDPL